MVYVFKPNAAYEDMCVLVGSEMCLGDRHSFMGDARENLVSMFEAGVSYSRLRSASGGPLNGLMLC